MESREPSHMKNVVSSLATKREPSTFQESVQPLHRRGQLSLRFNHPGMENARLNALGATIFIYVYIYIKKKFKKCT